MLISAINFEAVSFDISPFITFSFNLFKRFSLSLCNSFSVLGSAVKCDLVASEESTPPVIFNLVGLVFSLCSTLIDEL